MSDHFILTKRDIDEFTEDQDITLPIGIFVSFCFILILARFLWKRTDPKAPHNIRQQKLLQQKKAQQHQQQIEILAINVLHHAPKETVVEIAAAVVARATAKATAAAAENTTTTTTTTTVDSRSMLETPVVAESFVKATFGQQKIYIQDNDDNVQVVVDTIVASRPVGPNINSLNNHHYSTSQQQPPQQQLQQQQFSISLSDFSRHPIPTTAYRTHSSDSLSTSSSIGAATTATTDEIVVVME